MMLPAPETLRRILVLLMVLVAGCVDAIGFQNAEIFPANMTGNAVLIATSIAKTSPLAQAYGPALVLLVFCLGCCLATLLIRLKTILFINTTALVIFLDALIIISCGASLLLVPGRFSIMHLLAISFAMGMQSAAALALNVLGAGITVVITSTLTAAISKTISLMGDFFLKEHTTAPSAPVFPLLVFFIYFAGAFLGVFHPGCSIALVILILGILMSGVAMASTILHNR